MPSKPKVCKVLITNIVSLNTGDAAILYGTIEILKKKYGSSVNVIVFDKEADVAKKYYPWATFRQSLFCKPAKGWLWSVISRAGYGHWHNKLKYLRYRWLIYLLQCRLSLLANVFGSKEELVSLAEYVSADLILSTGGTYLIENYGLDPAIKDYRLAMATGNLFGFFTQTLGPFKQPENVTAFRSIFSSARIILLRDERSKKHIAELGVPLGNVHLAADAAFVLAHHENSSKMKPVLSGQPIRVAISVRSMNYFHQNTDRSDLISYFEGVALAVKIAVEEFGAKVTFLSTCQGIPEYWTNDANTADEIYGLLPQSVIDHVEIDRQFRQPWEIVERYAEFDLVIATRMHAAILALCAGTPTLGFAYEFKMEELFANIGMPELVLNVNSLSCAEVENRVRLLLMNVDSYRKNVVHVREKMCNEAWLALDALPDVPERSGFEKF